MLYFIPSPLVIFPASNIKNAKTLDIQLTGSYNIREVCTIDENLTTLDQIHEAAKAEFLQKGYKDASLRNIVKSLGKTLGAFYGYYKSKEELFEALVGEHYQYLIDRFKDAQKQFADLPHERQPDVMSDISGVCMFDMLHYAYQHLEECKLILCCSEGTRFSGLIDEMVKIEVEGTHVLITGMFHTFFELIIHEMPLPDAENYVRQMRAFYTAGWMKIMGQ